ncbi:CPBP family intramembrane glutamic endopeptidase [Mariniluteicoccus endophyticus]
MTLPTRGEPAAHPRPLVELALVLGVSLGESAIYSILRIVERMTRVDQPLAKQTAQMNQSVAAERPWLDLSYQIANLVLPLVPVALALYLLAQWEGPRFAQWDPRGVGTRRLGFDHRRPVFDLGWGLAIAAGIGIPGLFFYLGARQLGLNVDVQPGNLAENWWTVPVYVLAAAMNGILEEVIMIGYAFVRLRQARWSWPAVIVVSAVVRGSYHLYQGFGGFAGNVLMGILFGLLYLRLRRVGPLVAAHTIIDVAAFVGYASLHDRVGWL